MTAEKRPNILFCIADDASHFSAYGHTFVSTPNCDRVAREGILFNNMFTTNPKCAPSRASILTGKHTWELKEACTHWCVFPSPEELSVYPDILEQAGYHVGHTGKGWGPGDFQRRGRKHNPAGKAWNSRTLTPPEGSRISNCDYAANFRDFMAERKPGQPFCFWYGAREPHRQYNLGEGRRNGKIPDPNLPIPPYWPQEDIVREDMNDYAFEIEWFDRHVGLMLDYLEEIGELDNTLVIVTSDNGAPFPRVKGNMYDDDFRLPFALMWRDRVKGGRVVDDLCSFIDLAPTFYELAGVDSPPPVSGKSLTDIMFAEGSGMVTETRTRAYMGRERHDVGREGDVGYPVRCVRTPKYLYVRNFKPHLWPACNPETGFPGCDGSPTKKRILELHEAGDNFYFSLAFGKRPLEELYDMVHDPHCMINLAEREEYRAIKESLWKDLQAVLEATGDPRIRGEGDIFDTYEYVGNPTHSWKRYLEGTWSPPRH
ncbi:MAG: heparan N-sulfatase [Lentisphaerae bacterium]|nr:MAG: heparan N-sulfatase [Lentisphaerota bacterium]